ncbi:MAG: polyribonucleotide nucleotidyltransferase [Chitinophagales bacterium]|jgi:polyribonucleotide nucleotidyltransferase|nr:polyribonucleotide nucleotidyltransferase [Sphingobacteriales bacterium]MBP9141422.1 polyribonucleotide nucleotidyltransferase [Chitinophagales bacterium]MDA0197534.1 polyribonucleotide nucleotidyltransferase [Bacteroidota bacterium]MBK6890580.1 polyribonucleotide nucleotidyltransferase [Sphingobacteriales bacterium]MBK8680078.1 polyribonucleotide nucleotidyltransferase [Sphingobacteriales bacterium]
MSWQAHTRTFDFGDGRTLTIETGKLARQANGAVVVRMGKAVILATAVSNPEASPTASFFPLSVDYQEKFAANGRIPGGFLRREGRLSDYEILISRLVDRPIRPLFPDNFLNETQILIYLISFDEEVLTDALAGFAASAALTLSDIPFLGPIGEVRVARIDGQFVVNPSRSQMANADLDIMLAATEKDIMMVEGEAQECSEEDLVAAIQAGHEVIKRMCQLQSEMAAEIGKPKREVPAPEDNSELYQTVETFAAERIRTIAKSAMSKQDRKAALKTIQDEHKASLGEEPDADLLKAVKECFYKVEKQVIRDVVLTDGIRLDGRTTTDIRPLHMEIDWLPSPHGSSLFCRGETQSITTVTLGTKDDEQLIDRAEGLSYSKFLLHYNFPPFSTGEAKPIRGVGRREVGHGNLALRSLKQVLPTEDENPYTVRVVSDILESNGSSSMATVCAGSLALMDAGIKVKASVSGIAMGLITDGERFAILSDILGDEDHLGDMDFKVTGTAKGICGVQMDLKIDGLPYEVLTQALLQARNGRLHILKHMDEVIAQPREDYKPHAPRIEAFYIASEFIGAVIGKGGEVIQKIQRETGAQVSIEEIEGEGRARVTVFSSNLEALSAATRWVQGIATAPEEGAIYEGVVKGLETFGAFVEFLPGKQGLLHISEYDYKRIDKIEDVLNIGDTIQVKLLEVDQRSGKFRLSRKALLPRPDGYEEKERPPHNGGGHNRDRDRDRNRDNRGGHNDRRPPRR